MVTEPDTPPEVFETAALFAVSKAWPAYSLRKLPTLLAKYSEVQGEESINEKFRIVSGTLQVEMSARPGRSPWLFVTVRQVNDVQYLRRQQGVDVSEEEDILQGELFYGGNPAPDKCRATVLNGVNRQVEILPLYLGGQPPNPRDF
ncbi:hypothetical protein [Aeoliella straminimaris]|nr:hypothetical protein [Aeoliella straminimaris]